MLLVARRSHRLYRLVSESRTAMLREDAAELTVTGGASAAATKIRKRCAVSPSGALPDRQRRALRLKRGVRLVGHRKGGGAGTGASPCASSGRERRMSESPWSRHGHADVEAWSAASAQKLVSALWQLNKGDGGEAVARRSWSWIPADGDGGRRGSRPGRKEGQRERWESERVAACRGPAGAARGEAGAAAQGRGGATARRGRTGPFADSWVPLVTLI